MNVLVFHPCNFHLVQGFMAPKLCSKKQVIKGSKLNSWNSNGKKNPLEPSFLLVVSILPRGVIDDILYSSFFFKVAREKFSKLFKLCMYFMILLSLIFWKTLVVTMIGSTYIQGVRVFYWNMVDIDIVFSSFKTSVLRVEIELTRASILEVNFKLNWKGVSWSMGQDLLISSIPYRYNWLHYYCLGIIHLHYVFNLSISHQVKLRLWGCILVSSILKGMSFNSFATIIEEMAIIPHLKPNGLKWKWHKHSYCNLKLPMTKFWFKVVEKKF